MQLRFSAERQVDEKIFWPPQVGYIHNITTFLERVESGGESKRPAFPGNRGKGRSEDQQLRLTSVLNKAAFRVGVTNYGLSILCNGVDKGQRRTVLP